RARAVRVDDHQLRAVLPRLLDERPQVDIGAVDVRAPGDDVFGFGEGGDVGPHFAAEHADQSVAAGRGADGAVELRSAQPVEETGVYPLTIQVAERPAIRVGEDRLRSEVLGRLLQAAGDLAQRDLPGDAIKVAEIATAPTLGNVFLAAERIENAIR